MASWTEALGDLPAEPTCTTCAYGALHEGVFSRDGAPITRPLVECRRYPLWSDQQTTHWCHEHPGRKP